MLSNELHSPTLRTTNAESEKIATLEVKYRTLRTELHNNSIVVVSDKEQISRCCVI